MSNIQNAFASLTPILIEGHKAKAYIDKVNAFDPASRKAGDDLEDMLEMIFGEPPELIKAGSLAIIPIRGVIGSELTELEKLMGCIDVEDVEEMLEEAERDPNIKTILFDFNSPGGTVTGVPELANRIFNAKKRTIGWTCSQSCSGSMWLMSQCDEVYVSGSSTVGSIGVYIPVLDESKAYAEEGYEMKLLKSGWAKGAGYPGTKMSPEQEKLFLDDVAETHVWFISHVKRKRTLAKDEDMQGQCWSGRKAAAKMLVTGIKDTLDDLLKYIGADVYANLERQEPAVESAGSYAADVSPEQGEKDDGAEPIKDLKKKKKDKKSDEDEDEEEEMPKDIPNDSCPPVDTDGKG
jgi:protease-4